MRNRVLLSVAISLFALSLLWGTTGSLDPASWTFTPIDFPGADRSTCWDMNGSGQIVGEYHSAQDGGRGYVWSNGVFSPIVIGDNGNGARGISPSGEIVGWFANADDGYYCHSYSLRGGKIEQIDYPGAYYTIANAVNGNGEVVGFWGTPEFNEEHGFLLRGGVYTTIDYPGRPAFTNLRGINERGDIVGIQEDSEGIGSGFLLSRDGEFTAVNRPDGLPGGNTNGINSRGQIVGGYSVSGVPYGFLLSQGEYTPMIIYPGARSSALSNITDDGQHMVGSYRDQSGIQHGFVLSRKPLK